ncbi:M28 family metallopeptidase [Pedobacter heparinus]|uniref:M28 family metallopeptidase n=1 Tax=Pedobacter heparinus TaxID=984 RepID=UPI002930C761|nr:M28 family peptidase [Pedobacter heparinus]
MKKCLLLLCLLISRPAFSQDPGLAKKILNRLTAKTMWGRGYTKNGLGKAADYITAQFEAYGLIPMNGNSFQQTFSFPVNTFPGKMSLKINGKALTAGKDFILTPESKGKKASGKLEQKDSTVFISAQEKLIITLKDKLTWSVSTEQADHTGIQVLKTATEKPDRFELNIENQFVPDFKAANICAMVKGTSRPDSLIVLTAHYDHLGGMGAHTYFPGANDNASGISFLLSMAKYYAANPAPYSIAFLCFAGEEAGLLGSRYFTEHPLTALDKIRFLINVDMVGTGETGITVVNAAFHPKEFALLNKINAANSYLAKINPRGKAANSDHYFFSEKGVPAFFIYTNGGIRAYHDIYDRPATLPFTAYNNLFKLFVDFNRELIR